MAGTIANPMLQVMGAAASGCMSAAAINGDLVAADVARAVSIYRAASPPESNARRVHAGQGDTLSHALPSSSAVTHAHGGHSHGHHGDGAGDVVMDQAFWDERYGSTDALWSGNPNPQLLSEASDLGPGRALDVGCGEGADAIWLAERGWQVTALDISTVALERGAARAMEAGAEVAERITWLHADLASWIPGAESFDLVSIQFMHLPKDQREPLYRRLAESVAPGGTLLIVGHHPSDMQTTMPRPVVRDLFFTGSDLEADLDPVRWEIIVNAERERDATDPDGHTVTIHDTVLRARRRM
jgi:SAM-dependent methyltransferase